MSEGPLRLHPDFAQDPHRYYADLRASGPARKVTLNTGVQAWVVTDHAHARAALADPRLSKDFQDAIALFERHRDPDHPPIEFTTTLAANMLNSDPPDHTRLRKLVNKAFTARGVEHLRPRVEQIATDLLDAMAGEPEVDLLDTYAFPLPITVICELLGIPVDDRTTFRTWSDILVSDERGPLMTETAMAMAGYLATLIETKRAHPAPDLLTDLIRANEDDDRLSLEELVSMTFLLLIAGHETTVNLIGNAVLSLLHHPDQLAALTTDPTLVPAAIEEVLRYESPVNMATLRHTREAVEYGGVHIPAGELVFVSLGAANRDPERYPDPDALDLRRVSSHLAFGHGIHFCVGAPLARMEGEIALRALLGRYPGLTLVPGELRWRSSTLIRGLERLPVRLGA